MLPRKKEILISKYNPFFFVRQELRKQDFPRSPGLLFAVHKAHPPLPHVPAAEAAAVAQRHLPPVQQHHQAAGGGNAVHVELQLARGTARITLAQQGQV